MSEQLPLDLVMFEGHLTDVGMATLADGEEALLPADVVEHGRSCERCRALVQGEALSSLALGAEVRAASVAAVPARAAVPVMPLMVAALLAVAGFATSALESSLSLSERLRGARELFVLVARGFRALVRAELPPALTVSTSLFLVLVALVVMRTSPLRRAGA
ncbi:MAG: hypothetical protein IPG50_10290 [Myxococcales bacterium]|nr:hypothetical protein [Myxococcales bacterium]